MRYNAHSQQKKLYKLILSQVNKQIKSMKKAIKLLSQDKLTCFIIPQLFTPNQCKSLLFQHTKELSAFEQAKKNYPNYYRNNKRYVVDSTKLAQKLFQKVLPYLPQTIQVESEQDSATMELWDLASLNSRIRFCKYETGQYFNRHLDGVHYGKNGFISKLTFMVYLNSFNAQFEGGRTLFYEDQFKTQFMVQYYPSAGDLIIFDHNLWHQGQKVTKGEKYVMRSDIMYRARQNSNQKSILQNKKQNNVNHQGYIWSLISWSQNILLSSGRDKMIKVWNEKGICIQQLQKHENSVLCLLKLNQNTLVSCSRDKSVALWKFQSGRFHFQSNWLCDSDFTLLSLLKLNDQTFAVSGADSKIRIFKQFKETIVLQGHHDWVWNMVMIDESTFASCSQDKTIRLWDWRLSKQVSKITHNISTYCLLFIAKWNLIVVGDLYGFLAAYQVLKSEEKWRFQAHKLLIRTILSISPQICATGSQDGWVRIWRIESNGMKIMKEVKHENFVQSLCYVEGSLYSASYDGKIIKTELKFDHQ